MLFLPGFSQRTSKPPQLIETISSFWLFDFFFFILLGLKIIFQAAASRFKCKVSL